MVIAGPNGSGKSTLLNELRSVAGNGRIMYVGPHRTARRQNVAWRSLLTGPISLEELFARGDVPGYEGIRLVDGARDPWSFDEAGNYLKHGLCQIEIDRQEAIVKRFDQDGEVKKEALPDPWQPLRQLTSNLLPHLSFKSVDVSNRNLIRCLWQVHNKDTEVDYDDLSSGEKSIIQMFYPLIEHQVKAILAEIRRDTSAQARAGIAVLIDEPELHLHPNLQLKVFDYLRVLSSTDLLQIIVATHSPTIVEYATFDELFLLRPVELVPEGENQLIQVATDEDRLKLLRELFGSTANLTAMQPIIVVEGSEQTRASKTPSDRKLYRALHPLFDKVTLVPGGGKAECLRLLAQLNEVLTAISPELRARALLDRDLGQSQPEQGAHLLPVSMVENLLLDPDAIWEAIQSVLERSEIRSVDDIAEKLDATLDTLEDAEVERRTLEALGTAFFRPHRPLTEIPNQASTFVGDVQQVYATSRVTDIADRAREAVQTLKVQQRRREEFHGKDAIDAFYGRHLSGTGMAKNIFLFEAARYARRRRSVTAFFDQFFRDIGLASQEAGPESADRVGDAAQTA
jgi:ABC-type multidrug transport system ATPase subunit